MINESPRCSAPLPLVGIRNRLDFCSAFANLSQTMIKSFARGSPQKDGLCHEQKFANMKEPVSGTFAETNSLSRRRFIRNSSLAVSGTSLALNFPFVLTGNAAPGEPIRVGLIGCGGRGTGAVG